MKEPSPRGIYWTLWEWIETTRSDGQRFREACHLVHPAEMVTLRKPVGLERPVYPLFQQETTSIPPAYVAVLPEGRYWAGPTATGAIVSPDNYLIWDVSMQYSIPGHVHPICKLGEVDSPIHIAGTVAVLTFIWATNYFHWMFDVLPRIDLFRKSRVPVDKYIINSRLHPIQKQTLSMLGVLDHQLIEHQSGLHLKAEKLAVSAVEMYHLRPLAPHFIPKEVCGFLRNEFLSKPRITPMGDGHERIYISRDDAKRRKIINEDLVMSKLAAYGFKKVTMRRMSFLQQVQLFHSAEVIIAPHGAALANLVFCRPGTKVVDIFSPNYVNPCYWYLSSYVGLDYHYLFGKGLRAYTGIGSMDSINDNIEVEIGELLAMIELLKLDRRSEA